MTRNKALLLTGMLLTIAGLPSSAEPLPSSTPLTVAIVWDTSSSGGSYWPSYHSIVQQVCSSLLPGERVEVVSAHAGTPKLRVSHCIRTGDSQELASVYLLLQNITCPLFADARVDQAVEMACKRITAPGLAGQDGPAMLIILTNGNLSDQEVKVIRKIAEQFAKPGRRLYVTGTRSTDRELLISASQSLLEWSLIEQANAASWIRQLRGAVARAASGEGPQRTAVRQTRLPVSSDNPSYSVPEPQGTNPGSAEHPISAKVLVEVSSSEPRSTAANVTSPPRDRQSAAGSAIGSPKQQPGSAAGPADLGRPLPEVEPPARQPSSWTWFREVLARHWPWLVIVCALPLAALGYLFVHGSRRARQWSTRTRANLKDANSENDGVVVATLNGQTHHLGRLERFPIVTFGGDPASTIRLAEKGISGRLYYRGGSLRIQNLGTKPIALNSIPLAPRAKQRLVLPAILDLSESTKLTLSLRRSKAPTPTEEEVRHEQATAPQS